MKNGKGNLTRLALMAAAAGLALSVAGPASADTFVLIEKGLTDPFGAKIKQGCEDAAKELGDECIFIGPATNDDAAQIQILNDMISRGVDGIALAPRNPKSAIRFIKQIHEKGIPFITYDSDVLPEDADIRATFVGTDNYGFGVTLAEKVKEMKPEGGTVCIQSGTPGALNLDDRVQGVRDALAGSSKDKPVERLDGQNGWTEVSGCPLYNMDDITLSVQQINDAITAHPDLDALIAIGGWAQYAPDAYRKALAPVLERIHSKDFVIAFGDAEEPQMPLLKEGLSHVNVGQNPYQIGYKSILALKDLQAGKELPKYTDTGFVSCTPEQADTCGK